MSVDMAVKLLDESVGKLVIIKLKDSKVIRGILRGFDQHMNLVMEEAEEMEGEEQRNRLGIVIVRGDNVIMISPSPR